VNATAPKFESLLAKFVHPLFFDHSTTFTRDHRARSDPGRLFPGATLRPATTTSPLKYRRRRRLRIGAAAASCTNVRHHSVVMATQDRVANGPQREREREDRIVETTGGLQQQRQQQQPRWVAEASGVTRVFGALGKSSEVSPMF